VLSEKTVIWSLVSQGNWYYQKFDNKLRVYHYIQDPIYCIYLFLPLLTNVIDLGVYIIPSFLRDLITTFFASSAFRSTIGKCRNLPRHAAEQLVAVEQGQPLLQIFIKFES